jgi:hypothetical protein
MDFLPKNRVLKFWVQSALIIFFRLKNSPNGEFFALQEVARGARIEKIEK